MGMGSYGAPYVRICTRCPVHSTKVIPALRVAQVVDLKNAGYQAAELHDAGYTLLQLQAARFSVSNLRAASFLPQELRDKGGCSAEQMLAAGFEEFQLVGVYSQAELQRAKGLPDDLRPDDLGEEAAKSNDDDEANDPRQDPSVIALLSKLGLDDSDDEEPSDYLDA